MLPLRQCIDQICINSKHNCPAQRGSFQHSPKYPMPLQRTLSFVDICDENQPGGTSPPSLSPPTPDLPAISRRRMGSLCGSALFNSISGSSPAANPSSKPYSIPYRRSLQYYKDQRQVEKAAQRNKGAVGGSLAMDGSPSTLSCELQSPMQPSGTYMVSPSIFKPSVMTLSALPAVL